MDLKIGDRVAYVLTADHRLLGTIVNVTAKRVVLRLDRYPDRVRPVKPSAVVRVEDR